MLRCYATEGNDPYRRRWRGVVPGGFNSRMMLVAAEMGQRSRHQPAHRRFILTAWPPRVSWNASTATLPTGTRRSFARRDNVVPSADHLSSRHDFDALSRPVNATKVNPVSARWRVTAAQCCMRAGG